MTHRSGPRSSIEYFGPRSPFGRVDVVTTGCLTEGRREEPAASAKSIIGEPV